MSSRTRWKAFTCFCHARKMARSERKRRTGQNTEIAGASQHFAHRWHEPAEVEHRLLPVRPPPPLEGKVDLESGQRQPLEEPSGEVVAHFRPEGNILAILPPFAGREMAFLCVATLVPRALLATVLGVAGNPERWEYDVIAANIVNGQGHVYDREGFCMRRTRRLCGRTCSPCCCSFRAIPGQPSRSSRRSCVSVPPS